MPAILTRRWTIIVAVLALLDMAAGASAAEMLVIEGAGSIGVRVPVGGSFTGVGSIRNLSGRPMEVVAVSLSVETIPRNLTNIQVRLAPEFVAALGSPPGLSIPASGYEGNLYSVTFPPGMAPSASCELALAYGTNPVWTARSPVTFLNPPILSVERVPGRQVELSWSNSLFQPVLLPDLSGDLGLGLTNRVNTNGSRLSVSIPAVDGAGYFQLQAR